MTRLSGVENRKGKAQIAKTMPETPHQIAVSIEIGSSTESEKNATIGIGDIIARKIKTINTLRIMIVLLKPSSQYRTSGLRNSPALLLILRNKGRENELATTEHQSLLLCELLREPLPPLPSNRSPGRNRDRRFFRKPKHHSIAFLSLSSW